MDIDIASHWGTLADTLHDAVLVVNPEGQIVRINQAGEALTGYSREQIEGRNCRVLNCTGCKIIGQGSGVDYCGLFRAGEVRSKRCTITNRSGEKVVVLKRASVLKDAGGEIVARWKPSPTSPSCSKRSTRYRFCAKASPPVRASRAWWAALRP